MLAFEHDLLSRQLPYDNLYEIRAPALEVLSDAFRLDHHLVFLASTCLDRRIGLPAFWPSVTYHCPLCVSSSRWVSGSLQS